MSEGHRSRHEHRPNQRQEAFTRLIEEVEGLQEKYMIHGHGMTSKDRAESVLQRGLYTSWTTLQDITHPLEQTSGSLAKQMDNWSYDSRPYVILIAIPKHDDYFASDVASDEASAADNRERSRAFAEQHVFETTERPSDLHVSLSADKRIPPERIIGYWDRVETKLHRNPSFIES
ncbi:hypothetical protein KKH15_01640 [Patescibacteria group bacterium]|nr:hypothetical protein [Patescibacteria group bacterium]MBU1755350.1 hypothetical protein [Patescibacteria group bacterium]